MKRVLKKQNPNITIELTKTTKKEKIQAIVGIVIIAAAIVLIKFWRRCAMAEAKAGRPRKYDDPKEAQKIASQKWKEKNKERANFNRAKSAARSFIRNKASNDDLDELQQLINDRREQLK